MAEKRSFYNKGDNKGFTKRVFFETLQQIIAVDEVADTFDTDLLDKVEAAIEYEIESLDLAASKKGETTGEKKDPLQSGYAQELREAVMPHLTNEPKSAQDLLDEMNAAGKVSSKGKPFSAPWLSRVLNHEEGVVATKKVVEKVDAKGLKAQREVNAYSLA